MGVSTVCSPRARARVAVAAALIATITATFAQEDLPPVVEGGTGNLESRLSRVERLVDNQGLLDLANRVDELQREVQRLQGQIDEQQHAINEMSARRQRLAARPPAAAVAPPAAEAASDALPPISARPGEATAQPRNAPATNEGMPESPAVDAAAPPGQPPSQVAANAPSAPIAADADSSYDAAFNSLKIGKYDDAIAQFNDFLVTYPDSPRADSAQYWLGEAYYVNKQYDPAITEYQKLIAAYPDSQKVSQAMLKTGFCEAELGNREKARATLEEVKQRFPGTTSARMAEDRLQRLRLEQNP